MTVDMRSLSKNLPELEIKLKNLAENSFDEDGAELSFRLKYPRNAIDLTGPNIPTYSIDNSARSSQSLSTLERGSLSQLLSQRNSTDVRDSWSFSDSSIKSIERDSWSVSNSERNSTSVNMRRWSFSESIPESVSSDFSEFDQIHI